MCDAHGSERPRRAIALEEGVAHDDDHRHWTRRDFLIRSGLAATAGAFVLGGAPIRTLAQTPFLDALATLDTDRVLVLVQLSGGNDGLNTVVPVTNDLYYNKRPTLAIAPGDTFRLNDDLGLNRYLTPLEPFWGDGQLAVVQGVGYPEQNLSHFRSTDIWASASDSDEFLRTGWGGRAVTALYPNFQTSPPPSPAAVQIGAALPLLFQSEGYNTAMTFSSPQLLEQLATNGGLYDPAAVPATQYGQELSFVRTLANASLQYRESISAAFNASRNDVPYRSELVARSLASTARLIKGRLGTRIFLVTLDGFDTHANQPVQHERLLTVLGEALAAFHEDLRASGDAARVLTMTFSEFGRRAAENGNKGTDHGTAAPILVMGDGLTGGLFGTHPDLAALDAIGNVAHTTDFRSVYATVLQNWLGMEAATVNAVLGGAFDRLGFLDAQDPPPVPTGTPGLGPNYPNPFQSSTQFVFTLTTPSTVTLEVFDMQGRLLARPLIQPYEAGTWQVPFDGSRLATGSYLLRMRSGEGVSTRTIQVVR